MRTMIVGGSAAPRAMIEAFDERHGLHITHGWGMTEMSPIGTLSGAPGQEAGLSPQESSTTGARSRDCRSPFVEIRARGADGLVPWDGADDGRARGARRRRSRRRTTSRAEGADRWTDDGWFKTGDIVTIDPDGYVEIQDRAKDLVKSGGEWISTVALENALMGHPGGRGGGGDRRSRREVVRAAAGRRRPPGGSDGDGRRAPRVPRAELRQVVAAGPLRVRGRDPEDRRRQVPQDGAARAVRGRSRRRRRRERSSQPSRTARSPSSRSTIRR